MRGLVLGCWRGWNFYSRGCAPLLCSNKLTAWRGHPKVFCVFSCGPLKDAVGLGFLGKEVLLVVGVVQAKLVVALLGPGARAVKAATDTSGLRGVEIFGVAHGMAVGVLVVWVSAWSGVQGLIVIDGVLHGACRPFREGLVYVF